uniref:Cytochrome P450 n=1 Tax=Scoparia dulcis TaxID=107240 RepID=A0A1W7HBT1_SCODU
MSIFLLLSLFLLPVFFLINRRRLPKGVPPGSLGIPIIGQSLSLLWAMRANTAEQWIAERAKRYGPVSKMSLFGKPTVFIYGQAANKFLFASDGSKMSNHQTESAKVILGDWCLLELSVEDHTRVRNALASFLKPDCLKNYIGKMEEEIRIHLQMHWQGKQTVTVLPLMKTLTFNLICSLLFGLERGARRDVLVQYFEQIIGGMWSIPINVPFTRFNRSIKASAEVRKLLKELICKKRAELGNGASSHQDLITCLLSIHGEDNKELVSEDEIIHNVLLIMVAGHDTSSILLTFVVRLLANDKTIYESVLQEQEEIRNSKASGEYLMWEDLAKMKYTWIVVMETLRTIPPIFGGFWKTLEDIEYNGYLIPRGWQIFWVTCMTHMDGEIFPEPTKFDPSRFEIQHPYHLIPTFHLEGGLVFVQDTNLQRSRLYSQFIIWLLNLLGNSVAMTTISEGIPCQHLPNNFQSKLCQRSCFESGL